jgi:hypothetical protein
VVLNMDLPWNPAVLEQRVGRVHRLGQRRPVRVVNFVARGTIEEGMLGVLKFKQSLFAGVLDGGAKDVFLNGSRLNKFMESVEAATSAIPEQAQAEEAGEAPPEAPPPDRRGAKRRAAPPAEGDGEEAAPAPAAPADPWTMLLQAGMALLQQATGAGPGPAAAPNVSSLVRRDEQTGESYLRVPMPPPEVVDTALRALAGLLEGLRK